MFPNRADCSGRVLRMLVALISFTAWTAVAVADPTAE